MQKEMSLELLIEPEPLKDLRLSLPHLYDNAEWYRVFLSPEVSEVGVLLQN